MCTINHPSQRLASRDSKWGFVMVQLFKINKQKTLPISLRKNFQSEIKSLSYYIDYNFTVQHILAQKRKLLVEAK